MNLIANNELMLLDDGSRSLYNHGIYNLSLILNYTLEYLSGIGIVFGRGTLRSSGGKNEFQGGAFQRIDRRENHSKHSECHCVLSRREKNCAPRFGEFLKYVNGGICCVCVFAEVK